MPENLKYNFIIKIIMAWGQRRVYGESRIDECPFCGKRCYIKNPQGIPVCKDHQNKTLENLKCVCGEWLDLRQGKWGPFFTCMNCGNMSVKKAMQMNNLDPNYR
ncbi:hypothetical protein JW868_02570 [Candidatus Woesearchaeota archaeon]|nr:hypothetical protein [Candidatus Woesearchaeota archaeon]